MKYPQRVLAAVVVLWSGSGGLGAQQIRVATSAEAPVNDSATARARVLLATPVSMSVVEMPLRRVIDTLAAQASAPMVYRRETVNGTGKVVTLHVTRVSLSAVLDQALAGTSLRAVPLSGGRIGIVDGDRSGALQQAGGVRGRVVDAKTKQPLRDVVVTLDDSGSMTRTNEEGRYHFVAGTAGVHRISVRTVGYARQSKMVTIVEGQSVEVDFVLESTVNTLDQVVVTATGEQRIRELGHVVAQVNADSLVREAPIASMSELLQSRVPGLQILTQSGGVAGGEVSLRLRGTTTLNLDPEPIVIVDGVRFRSNNLVTNGPSVQEDVRGLVSGSGALHSPLNDLNPNDVESVEVVKGPSASALYGPDASNGVIVIRTKRGVPGKPRFSWYVRPMDNAVPKSRIDETYQAWGHDADGALFQGNCTLILQYYYQQCTLDSIARIPNAISNDAYSIVAASRPGWQYGASLSGGGQVFRYRLSGNYDSQIGALQIPPAVQTYLAQLTGVQALSDAMRNPNALQTLTLQTNGTADLGTRGTVDVNLLYIDGSHHIANLNAVQSGQLVNGVLSPGTDSSSLLTPFIDAGTITTTDDQTNRVSGTVHGTARLLPWLSADATVGLDLAGIRTRSILPNTPQVTGASGVEDDRRTELNRTVSGGMVATAHMGMISFRSSLGVQYQYANTDGLNAFGSDLPVGSTSISVTSPSSLAQVWSEMVSLGTYGEEVVGVNDRLFITGSLRYDGSASLGDKYHPRPYPKAGLSWIASDEPWLQHMPGIRELRFRTSYGVASRYPTSEMKLGSVDATNWPVAGSSQLVVYRGVLANPLVHPEQNRELEYGADVTVLSNVVLNLTWYRRHIIDELAPVPNGDNVNGLYSYWVNGPTLRQHGFEATATVPVLTTRGATGSVSIAYALRADRVERLGAMLPDTRRYTGGPAGLAVGYPIGAVFGRRILGVLDTVGTGAGHAPDGIVFPEEVVRDSITRFLGVITPPRTLTVTPTMVLAGGWLRVSALFDRQTGFLRYDYRQRYCATSATCSAPFERTTPLLQQAPFAEQNAAEDFLVSGNFTRWREANITVDVPHRLIAFSHFSRATLSLQGRNLKLWTAYTGTDPESYNSFTSAESSTLPQARTWSFRFDVTP